MQGRLHDLKFRAAPQETPDGLRLLGILIKACRMTLRSERPGYAFATISEVSDYTGISRSALSGLESGRYPLGNIIHTLIYSGLLLHPDGSPYTYEEVWEIASGRTRAIVNPLTNLPLTKADEEEIRGWDCRVLGEKLPIKVDPHPQSNVARYVGLTGSMPKANRTRIPS